MGQDLRKQLMAATIISVPDGVEDMAGQVQRLGINERGNTVIGNLI